MKKLSDYQGDEAIELWADLITPMSAIVSDPNVANVIRSGKPYFLIAQEILKSHKSEATEILMRIDDTPIDGMNIIVRIVNLVLEFANNEELKDFFVSAGVARTENESSGSATANIKVVEA